MNIKNSPVWRRIKEHLWGPVGSVVFHVLLLVIVLTAAFRPAPPPPALTEIGPDIILPLIPTPPPPLPPPVPPPAVTPPTVLPPPDTASPLPDKAPTEADFNFGALFPGNGGPGGGGDSVDLQPGGGGRDGEGSGIDFIPNDSPLHIPGIGNTAYVKRRAPVGPGDGGGSTLMGSWVKPINDAIWRALRWLKANQNDDGSWGPNPKNPGDVARTGLAVLCFLGFGQSTDSAEFGLPVEKGINWLKSQQKDDGHFSANPYMHAIATYAMSESFGMTRIPDLREAMDKAVGVILAGQQPGGGWDYNYAKGARRDTSVGAWQSQALKAAVIAGCTVPGIQEAMALAAKDLKSVQDPVSGRFGYDHRGGGSWAMTGAGVLCLQLLGYGSDTQTLLGLKALKDFKPRWEAGGEWAHYALYYITQAKYYASEAALRAWNPVFVPLYCRHQNADGSWSAMQQSNEAGQGVVYTTTLGTLTMEVFFRTLPRAGATETARPGAAPPATGTNAADVTVKIL